MALQTAVGTFQALSTTGPQSITGVGFTPSAVLFYGSSTIAGACNAGIGLDDGGATHYGLAFNSGDVFGVVSTTSWTSFTHSLNVYRNAAFNNLAMTGYVSGWTSDGFTIQWDFLGNASWGGTTWHYVAFGGDGVSTKVGRFQPRSTAGTQSITGVGFEPAFVLFNRVPLSTTAETTTGPIVFGFAASDVTQAVLGTNNPTKSYPPAGTQLLFADQCLNAMGTYEASLTSMDADGFTLDYATTGLGVPYVQYLAVGGASVGATAGILTQPTSLQTQTISGLSVAPQCVLFLSTGRAASATIDADCAFMLGAMSETTSAVHWCGVTAGGSAPMAANSGDSLSLQRAIEPETPTGNYASTADAIAIWNAFGSDSFSVQWTLVDSTPRAVAYLALGAPNAAGSGTIVVTKLVSPASAQTFDFTAGGGLTPTDFTLGQNESRSFAVSAGSGYSVAETPITGWTTTVQVSNSSAPDNLIVAMDETVTVTFTNVATTYPLRRLRRFPLPFTQNKWVYLQRLEVFLQAGQGLPTGQGSDPLVMLRLSKDGGQTWGNEIQMAAGRLGQYGRRCYANRLGRGRNWVAEVTVTDPVPWFLIDCWVDVEMGES